ncbi:hypothetical protein GARCT_01729 [Geobacillus sp. 12AMOR1]|nr:hypothetical protein GARCT_01729 [Geobacillus sp. 12AMOR1]
MDVQIRAIYESSYLIITHISHPLDQNREDFFVFMSNESLTHKQRKGVFPSWTFEFARFMKVPI